MQRTFKEYMYIQHTYIETKASIGWSHDLATGGTAH